MDVFKVHKQNKRNHQQENEHEYEHGAPPRLLLALLCLFNLLKALLDVDSSVVNLLVKLFQLLSLLLRLDCKVSGHVVDVRHDISDHIDVLLALGYYVLHILGILGKSSIFVR